VAVSFFIYASVGGAGGWRVESLELRKGEGDGTAISYHLSLNPQFSALTSAPSTAAVICGAGARARCSVVTCYLV
jgi:hypothetical protein